MNHLSPLRFKQDGRRIRTPICNERFWNEKEQERRLLDDIAEKMSLSQAEDWYKVRREQYVQHGASELLRKYASIANSLDNVYCDTSWQHNLLTNQREFFDFVAELFNIKRGEDWYKITRMQVEDYDTTYILDQHQRSLASSLAAVFSQTTWQHWRFDQVPSGYWDHIEHHREYFEWLEEQLGYSKMEHWYRLTANEVIDYNGTALLALYDNSLHDALDEVFPEYVWHPWKFSNFDVSYWSDVEHHHRYFEWCCQQLNISTVEDWYKVTQQSMKNLCCNTPVNCFYQGRLGNALATIYPSVDWQLWRFDYDAAYWNHLEHHSEFVRWFEKKLNILSPEEWSGVPSQFIVANHGGRILNMYGGSLINLMRFHYPSVTWDPNEWHINAYSKGHHYIHNELKKLLGDVEIECNVSVWPLKYGVINHRSVVFDIWIPARNLIIEHHGKQHYQDARWIHTEDGLEAQYCRDFDKEQICDLAKLTLMNLPFWWDFNSSHLESMVNQQFNIKEAFS